MLTSRGREVAHIRSNPARDIVMMKNHPGNYFEHFRLGQVITHATPRTVTAGDVSLYTALCGARFAAQPSDHFARAIRSRDPPVHNHPLLTLLFRYPPPHIS